MTMNLFRKTFAEINVSGLKSNVKWIQDNFPQAPFLCPMVKGNAYGHGDFIIAKSLQDIGIDHLGVCLIEEALWLKQSGIKVPIVVFRGFDQAGAIEIINNGFIPVVSQWEQLDYLEDNAKNGPIPVHLKFDTGMNRLGFKPEDSNKLYDRFWQNNKLRLKAILTHLYMGEDFLQEAGHSQQQLKKLSEVANVFQVFSPVMHALNSAGIFGAYLKNKNDYKNFGLRPGLMIYGYAPEMNGNKDKANFLTPVMTLKSSVSDIKFVSKGQGVSYSHTWIAKHDSIIGIVPIGYADGVHRLLSNRGSVIVNNQRAPIIGNICMDYLMIDLTAIDRMTKVNKNCEVILLGFAKSGGEFIGADEQAVHAQTITWEVLTNVGVRVPRVVV